MPTRKKKYPSNLWKEYGTLTHKGKKYLRARINELRKSISLLESMDMYTSADELTEAVDRIEDEFLGK